MSGEVIDRDLGWAKLMKEIGGYKEAYTKVGIQGTQAGQDHEGLSNVELAAVHEYGCKMAVTPAQQRWMGANLGMSVAVGETLEIPQRSFIRASMDANQSKYFSESEKYIAGVYEGKWGFRDALYYVGAIVRRGMLIFIRTGKVTPPLSQVTIERKNSSQPLIDTGQLANSITQDQVVK